MKCEICHKAEAKTAITAKVDGVEKELYVCATCAAAAKAGKTKHTPRHKPGKPDVTIINGADKEPPPYVEELVKATLGFMKEVAEAEENEKRVCPICKAKWDKIKESGHLGCPACWKTFARQIREEFLHGEWGAAHNGRAPAVETLPDATAARTVLERDLKKAIAREDYRRAAELKRQLDALGNEKDAEK